MFLLGKDRAMKTAIRMMCLAAIVAAFGSPAMANTFNMGRGLTGLETIHVLPATGTTFAPPSGGKHCFFAGAEGGCP